MMLHRIAPALLAALIATPGPAPAQTGLTADEIDVLARRAMTAFDVPGMAIGVGGSPRWT